MGDLLRRLLGLESRLDAESQARPLLSDPWLSGWALLGILLVVYFYYRRLYRRDGQRLRPGRVRVLYAIRIALALIVVLMLLRPALDIVQNEARLPVVAVLVDESASMTLPAGRDNPLLRRRAGQKRSERSRYAAAVEAVVRLQEALTKTHRVKVYTFSDTLNLVKDIAYRGPEAGKEPTPPDEIERIRASLKPPTGEHTDIADAIVGVLDELKGVGVSAVVLLSDGRATDETDLRRAVEAARRRGVPVHTVTCGTEEPLRDLAIQNLITPEEANLNDVMPLRATLLNHIRPRLDVELKVFEEGKLVATQPLTLDWGRNDRTITVIPRVKGERRFRLELPSFPDELTLDNNHKEFTVTVVERELRVLFIASTPTIEYHFIVMSLLRDPVMNVSCWLQSADIDYIQPGNTVIERLPRTLKEWEQYHVVILYDIDPNQFNNEQETALEALVRGGGGVLFIAGRMHGMDKLLQVRGARMKALLPVEIDKSRPPNYQEVFDKPFYARRTAAGRKHPIFSFEMDEKANDAVWATLPRFYWSHPVLGPKPTAVSLLERTGPAGGRGRCLMAIQRYGKGVAFYSGIQTLWRWRYPYENYDYDRFWRQLVRYLGETKLLGAQKQVALYTDKTTYSPGETVQITLAVLDPALLNQLRSETLRATIVEPSGAELVRPMRLVSQGDVSEYRATYRARRVGRYRVNARHVLGRGSSDLRPLFNESREFTVELQSLEFVDATADPEAMKQLAAATGGKAFARRALLQLPSLARDIPAKRQFIPHQTIEDIWDSPLFLLVFLALISTEWALRKHWDLL